MNPLLLVALLGALFGGVSIAVQAPTNAMLARAGGSPVIGALISFMVGTAALLLVALALGLRAQWPAMRSLPWYAWIGGLYGAFYVAAASFAAPRMGVTFFLIVLIAGQLATALLLDRLGAFGMPRTDISLARIAGVLLVFAGAFLVRR